MIDTGAFARQAELELRKTPRHRPVHAAKRGKNSLKRDERRLPEP